MTVHARLAVLLATALLAPAALGHQLKAAISTVLFNERTQRVEVMHRFYSHDAEHALKRLRDADVDIVDSEDDQLHFGVYVHERFELVGDGTALPLTLRGVELDGDFLWVYQAAPMPDPLPASLTIAHGALRDVWPEQVNTVNVERAGSIETLTFRGDRRHQRIELPGGAGPG